jgi:hypothetical protein
MTMQASTLGILEAADFSPKQAHALAQAIESEIKGYNLVTVPRLDERLEALDFVTVPMFDGRMKDLKLELSAMENRLITSTVKFGLTLAGITLGAIYFMLLNFRR